MDDDDDASAAVLPSGLKRRPRSVRVSVPLVLRYMTPWKVASLEDVMVLLAIVKGGLSRAEREVVHLMFARTQHIRVRQGNTTPTQVSCLS